MGFFSGLKKIGSKVFGGIKKIAAPLASTAMSFIPGLGTVGKFLGAAAGNVAGSVASGLGGVVTDKIFGTTKDAQKQLDQERQWTLDKSEQQTRLGNQLDLANQKEMYDYRINRGISEGMTPYEMHMGPAGGGGGGTSASGQTMGNAASQQGQIAAQAAWQSRENALNRQVELQKTAMQTQASTENTKISAGATTGAAEITSSVAREVAEMRNAIDKGQLELSKREFEERALPLAAAQLELTEAQTKKMINDVATSGPEFTLMMKRLSMGADNMMVEFIQNAYGIDVTNRDQVASLSKAQRTEFVTAVAALNSNVFREAAGAKESLTPTGTWLGESAAKLVEGGKEAFNTLKSVMPAAGLPHVDKKSAGSGSGW